jgi:hypothetical protein
MKSREAVTRVTVAHYIYTPTAIEQTINEFHELCEVETDVDGESTRLLFRPKIDCPSTVSDDFLNYALELSALELLSKE